MAQFIHLHVHTMYSLLDGANRIPDLATRAAEWGMPAMAVTDHGNLFGAIEFYKEIRKAGVKPIIGCEVYVAIEGRRSRKAARGLNNGANHLVLLAENNRGYRNLMKVVSRGYQEGFYYVPRVDKELLREYHQGLICMSACMHGEIPHLILMGQPEKAREVALEYQSIFGSGNFFLEIQRQSIEGEEEVNRGMVDLSKELGIPLVATNDAHYMEREHARAHEILLCIQTGKVLSDPKRMKFGTDEVYLKSEEEMRAAFSDIPEALDITSEIADRCNVEISFGQNLLPQFPLPEGYETPDAYLQDLAWRGLDRRYGCRTPELESRLAYEIDIIRRTGFAGYFLIVADYVGFAKSNGISVGPGRGSGAASLVAYSLGITDIDPMKYDLLFERFLNPERIEMPDFDIDFSDKDRERVITYVVKKYGEANVCQIITFGTMAAKGVIRDVGRVLGLPYADVDRIAKLVPNDLGITLDRAIEVVPDLARMAASEGTEGELISYARTLEGLARHASVHAAAVVITPGELTDYVPLCVGKDGKVTTQYDMYRCTELGLLKMDFLGLKELSLTDEALRLIRKREPDFDLDRIPFDDASTFELFGRAETVGVFQFESGGMRDYLQKLVPDNMEDIIAMNALYRPGPMAYIPDYISRKHGQQEVRYDHPLLEPILSNTYGVCVYQEQVLRIAQALAGFSLGQADVLRKAMGKKKADVMAQQRLAFLDGCDRRGVDLKIAEKVFDDISLFAGYAFNRAHAAGYAVLAYRNAYLKTHYPREYMAASLTNEMSNSDRIPVLIEECRRMGTSILPPDVNECAAVFVPAEDGIRFGLAAVRNVGHSAVDAIVRSREAGPPFSDLFDFCERIDLRVVNKRALESLVQAGAMDSLGGHRAQLLAGLDRAVEAAQTSQADRDRGQISLFDLPGLVKDTAVRRKVLPDAPRWQESEILLKEKEMLGFYVSSHPLLQYAETLNTVTTHTAAGLREASDGLSVRVGGLVTECKNLTDKNGRTMAILTLEDFSGTVEVVVFADSYDTCRDLVKKDSMLVVRGKITDRGNGRLNVRAEEIVDIREASGRFTRVVGISVPATVADEAFLIRIRGICQQYPGPCALLIRLSNGNGREYTVRSRICTVSSSDELIEKLRVAAGGRERVWVE